ncbi:right-handed parallel beta-helix repeat-containing protein, partial [Candidatus Neomarinimicrobiota bacterium]
ATISQVPIMDSAIVNFSWPTIAVDNFLTMEIYRRIIGDQADENDTAFTLQGSITSAADTSWQEVLSDDADLLYRFIIYTEDAGPIGSSDYLLEIPATTKFIVDPLIDSLGYLLQLPLVDGGDTLILIEGDHFIEQQDLTQKPGLVIVGSGASYATRINWVERDIDVPDKSDPIWFMFKFHDATLLNLTLSGGKSIGAGGAVTATGNTLIRNCLFSDNSAMIGLKGGAGNGGAILVSGSAIIENCVFLANQAITSGGDIFITNKAKDIEITNCTFRNSSARDSGQSIASSDYDGEVNITNCLFDMAGNGAISLGPPDLNAWSITYSMAQEQWDLPDSTNIIGRAAFISPRIFNYRLADGSPGIDAGNPEPRYNDLDGTRNDMGAYGGPYGNW